MQSLSLSSDHSDTNPHLHHQNGLERDSRRESLKEAPPALRTSSDGVPVDASAPLELDGGAPLASTQTGLSSVERALTAALEGDDEAALAAAIHTAVRVLAGADAHHPAFAKVSALILVQKVCNLRMLR